MSTLMTVPEVARHLRVHPQKVRDLANQGRLPRVRISGKFLFREEDVERAVRAATSEEPKAD
jgi:excisionase family DNA binding protein